MKKNYLFCDASVNTKTKVGFGAYFILEDLTTKESQINVQTNHFQDTSSTKLELQNLLLALKDSRLTDSEILIYTDSQNIISLIERRLKLESKEFKNGKGILLKNHELYKEFYKKLDLMNFQLTKIKGHKKSSAKDSLDKLFSIVDKASRNALRNQ